MSCILRYQGVKLIQAYSWARPAVLAAGMGRVGMFSFLLCLHFHSFSSFSPVPLSSPHLFLLSLLSFSLGVEGVVGLCEGVVSLTSPGRSTDIGLHFEGKGRGFYFFYSSLSFLFVFLPCSSLSSLLLSLLSLFSLPMGDDTKWPTRVAVSLNTNTTQSIKILCETAQDDPQGLTSHVSLNPNTINQLRCSLIIIISSISISI